MLRCLIAVLCLVAVSSSSSKDYSRYSDYLNEEFKIVPGKSLQYKVAPYQVSIQRNKLHRCTGSILDPSHILTTAHCVKDVRLDSLLVRSGSVIKGLVGTLHGVVDVHLHPRYCMEKDDYDLAILDLKTPIEVTFQSKPIPVVKTSAKEGDLILMTEFDKLNSTSTSPDILLGVYTPLISAEECKSRFPGYTDNMICADLPKVGDDICKGDGGGPAIIRGKLVGVTIVGAGCGKDRNLGVYMDVSKFIPYLLDYSNPKLV